MLVYIDLYMLCLGIKLVLDSYKIWRCKHRSTVYMEVYVSIYRSIYALSFALSQFRSLALSLSQILALLQLCLLVLSHISSLVL